MSEKSYIIALDFDGTLVEDKFPDIGEPNQALFSCAKMWQSKGAKLILWTCRDNERLRAAISFCYGQGLVFDAVNENLPEIQEKYGGDTRKVFADIYIDDKAFNNDYNNTLRLVGELIDASRNNDNK